MIESITLTNVETHDKRTLAFDGELTCIVGESDGGKSALMRALSWVLLNRPSGTAMISHGKKFARAVLKIDGKKVTRKRGRSNTYKLEGKKRPYFAFGTGVPPEIADLARVDEVNFQSQMDGPFWFSDSPGKVSRELNRVVNLDEIDKVLTHARREAKASEATVKVSRERLKAAKVELENLTWVPRFIKGQAELREREQELLNKSDLVNRLHSLVNNASQLEARANRAGDFAKRGNSLVARGNAIFALQAEVDSLEAMLARENTLNRDRSRKTPDLKPLSDRAAKLKALEEETIRLDSLLTRIQAEEEIWQQARRRSIQAAKELSAVKACPLCKSPLS